MSNNRQLYVTLLNIFKFQRELDAMYDLIETTPVNKHPMFLKAKIDSARSMIEELEEKAAELEGDDITWQEKIANAILKATGIRPEFSTVRKKLMDHYGNDPVAQETMIRYDLVPSAVEFTTTFQPAYNPEGDRFATCDPLSLTFTKEWFNEQGNLAMMAEAIIEHYRNNVRR